MSEERVPEASEDTAEMVSEGEGASVRTAADDHPRPSGGGRVLASLAILLALGAAAAAGYVYYLTVYQHPLAGLEPRFAALEKVQREETAQARQAVTDAAARLQSQIDAETEARQQAEEALTRSISEGMRLSPPSTREWKLAEVEYLLRIANHRLLMERDAAAAARLLATADEVLAELDDYALYPVRAQLAEERLALANVEEIDIPGAFLRLEAVKSSLTALPLGLPEYLAERRPAREPAAERSLWQAVLDRLGTFVELRRHAEGVRPLLGPVEAGYLEMNLRLMLERAQLALLRRDGMLYRYSLASALRWLDDYLDEDSPAVVEVRAELQSLATLDLERELPDISGSLTNLRSLSRYGIEDVEATP